LASEGLEAALGARTLDAAAQACARLYFEHVAAKGPIIHLILRDAFMRDRIDPENRRFRDRIMRRLAGRARRELGLSAKEAVAALNLVLTIPEQAGRMAWSGDMDRARARSLMRELVASSLEAIGSAGQASAHPAVLGDRAVAGGDDGEA
jgi:hypothetical protein